MYIICTLKNKNRKKKERKKKDRGQIKIITVLIKSNDQMATHIDYLQILALLVILGNTGMEVSLVADGLMGLCTIWRTWKDGKKNKSCSSGNLFIPCNNKKNF